MSEPVDALSRPKPDHVMGTAIGSVQGALATALGFAAVLVFSMPSIAPGEGFEAWSTVFRLSAGSGLFAGMAFALGIFLLGLPLRWLLSRLRIFSPVGAATSGAVLSGMAAAMLFSDVLPTAIIGFAGAFAGTGYLRGANVK